MRALTLIAASDEYDNKPGLMIKTNKGYYGAMAERQDGILIAHDIVEHQNGIDSIGPIWDELQALGGIWHARGRWGDMMKQSMHSCAVNAASDLTRMARDLAYSDSWFDQMGRDIVTRAHDHDDDFKEIIEIARHDIPAELDDDCALDIDRYLQQSLSHMRIGFRKCNKRFGDRFASNKQMRAIAKEVARAVQWIDYEGQEFRLLWGNGECCIREIYDSEYY